jgi:hypothetical protein
MFLRKSDSIHREIKEGVKDLLIIPKTNENLSIGTINFLAFLLVLDKSNTKAQDHPGHTLQF